MIQTTRQHDPDWDRELKGIEAALLRAAARARETARRHGTKLVIWRDGKVCEVNPDEAPLPEIESREDAGASLPDARESGTDSPAC